MKFPFSLSLIALASCFASSAIADSLRHQPRKGSKMSGSMHQAKIVRAQEEDGTIKLECPEPEVLLPTRKPPSGENPCEGMDPEVPAVSCVLEGIEQTGEQSGTNVTKGYQGLHNVTSQPLTVPFFEAGLCPVNVHWHLGTEHYSLGQYDETGTGPIHDTDAHNSTEAESMHELEDSPADVERAVDGGSHRRLSEGAEGPRQGFKCKLYDADDAKFTTPFEFQHCHDMKVGETYEVHWPHSALGACGTVNQFQSPFIDGVFCRGTDVEDYASQIGVQAQVFVVVNDESYYYPDLMRGMIVDGEMGVDVDKYTGSTLKIMPLSQKSTPQWGQIMCNI